jgi:hypothetical protein
VLADVTLTFTVYSPVAPFVPGTPTSVYPKLSSVAPAATGTDITSAASVVSDNSLSKSAPPDKSEFVLER